MPPLIREGRTALVAVSIELRGRPWVQEPSTRSQVRSEAFASLFCLDEPTLRTCGAGSVSAPIAGSPGERWCWLAFPSHILPVSCPSPSSGQASVLAPLATCTHAGLLPPTRDGGVKDPHPAWGGR